MTMYTIYKRHSNEFVTKTQNPVAHMISWLGGNATLKDVMEQFVITKERLWVVGELKANN